MAVCAVCHGLGFINTDQGLRKCLCKVKEDLRNYMTPVPVVRETFKILTEPSFSPTLSGIYPYHANVVASIATQIAGMFPKPFIWATWDSLIMTWMDKSTAFTSMSQFTEASLVVLDMQTSQFNMNNGDAVVSELFTSILNKKHRLIVLIHDRACMSKYPLIVNVLKQHQVFDPKGILS
jgi:hypothetical protein